MQAKAGSSALVDVLTQKRNTVFLWMCFFVHFSYAAIFAVLGIIPMAVLNCISTVFYTLFLISVRHIDTPEKVTLSAYFEIILFSMCSEMFTQGKYGFITFPVGMIPVVFYLIPSYKNKRFLFQAIGMILTIIMYVIDNMPITLFPATYNAALPYGKLFRLLNLIVTLCTIMYTSFFYEMQIDAAKNELAYNCTHDTLTGLYNRRFLYDLVKNSADSQMTVALLDIDNFKHINDNFGHDIGDETLVAVSGCISEASGASDIYCVRWGGEEFVIYCKNTDIDTAHSMISAVCSRISETVALPDKSHVTVTAGLVSGRESEFEKVIKKADDYLYLGKQNGKNCIIWYQNEEDLSAAV